MDGLTPALLLALLVNKVMDFLKFVRAKDTNAAITQLSAWVLGVVVLMLFRESSFADGVSLMGHTLASLNWAATVVIGLLASSLGSFIYDMRKTLDVTQTVAVPPLIDKADPDHVEAPRKVVGAKRARQSMAKMSAPGKDDDE